MIGEKLRAQLHRIVNCLARTKVQQRSMAPKPLLPRPTLRSDAAPGGKLSNREAMNQTLNEPSYSPLAMVISNVVMLAIVVSTASFVISSMPAFQDADSKGVLAVVEVIVVGIFTVEYVCRFTVHIGSRCAFVLSPMNMIDLVAILPFYVEKFFGGGEGMAVLRVLRVVRIFRVFKLMSKSKMAESLQMFVQTLVKSVDALKMLCVFFSLAVLIFSSLLYYAEKDRDGSPFISIPVTFWWAVVTMTTVGYGDMYPEGTAGRMVATVAMISGVLVLALPLSVIGSNFSNSYDESMKAKAYQVMEERAEAEGSKSAEGEQKFVNMMLDAARQIDQKKEEIDELLQATSYAMGTKSKGHAAKAIRAQFELQVENVKQALDAVTATLSDPNVLPCILGDQPERPSATRHV
jgi:voltage-gated potassium channel Kch